MKAALTTSLGVVLLLAFAATAQEKKEVTLQGNVTCAKCDLKKETKCMTVIVVKEGDKEVVYYLDDASSKTNHKTICIEAKAGSVTGSVSEKDGKKVITATKVEFK